MSLVILARKTKLLNSRGRGDNSNKGPRNEFNCNGNSQKINRFNTVSSGAAYIRSKTVGLNQVKIHRTTTQSQKVESEGQKTIMDNENNIVTHGCSSHPQQQESSVSNSSLVLQNRKAQTLCWNNEGVDEDLLYIKNTICTPI
jgi:hypothetical protein